MGVEVAVAKLQDAKQTGRGWRLVQGGNAVQIDAAIALAMAVERAQVEQEPARLLGWV